MKLDKLNIKSNEIQVFKAAQPSINLAYYLHSHSRNIYFWYKHFRTTHKTTANTLSIYRFYWNADDIVMILINYKSELMY